jgi:hypothetical protein
MSALVPLRLATPPDPGTAAPCVGSGIARPTEASPSEEVEMARKRIQARCPQSGLALPECSCRRCCRELVRHYAPELVASGRQGRRRSR